MMLRAPFFYRSWFLFSFYYLRASAGRLHFRIPPQPMRGAEEYNRGALPRAIYQTSRALKLDLSHQRK